MASGVSDGGGAGAHAELVEDAGDMGGNGARADEEPVGNVAIGQSFGYQVQYLAFPLGEASRAGRVPGDEAGFKVCDTVQGWAGPKGLADASHLGQ